MKQQNAPFNLQATPRVAASTLVQELVRQGVASESLKIDNAEGDIVIDSRKITPGCIYIAIKGGTHDGHAFIDEAFKKGAALVVCEKKSPAATGPQLVVRNSREAWAWACSLAYSHPGEKLKLIGVTGTNGKTSTVWMIKGILEAFKIETATIGTLGFYCGNEHFETEHTTPDPPVLYNILAEVARRGIGTVAMEVSSHALTQKKLSPLKYAVAGMTSFSQDHLDLHGTMEEYLATKLTLFKNMLLPGAKVFLHLSVEKLARSSVPKGCDLKVYGHEDDLDLSLSSRTTHTRDGSNVSIKMADGKSLTFQIPFIGEIFCNNFAGALIAASAQSADVFKSKSSDSVSHAIKPVPGRLEPVKTIKPWQPLVLVDYSHTPDALEKALEEARAVTPGKLISVFGCGGDRDKTKRPLMGEISTRLADFTFITSDNPRTEDPDTIIREIEIGAKRSPGDFKSISDRHTAIREALAIAGGADTVLIAGKGHEHYQIIGREKKHFSDVEEAQTIFAKGRNWCVIGGGVSGQAAALYLRCCGENVVVSDGGKVSDAIKEKLTAAGIQLFQGGHDLSHLKDAECVLLSPGVPQTNPLFVEARKRKLPLATEIDLGVEHFKGSLVSVTGTNGKSTTCAMIEHSFKELGHHAKACGNIGVPPTALTPRDREADAFWVCELSSYQLEHSHRLPTRVAVITSFSFDHLARHGSLKEYFACKWRVAESLGEKDLLLLRGEVLVQAKNMGFSLPKCRVVVVHDAKSAEKSSENTQHWWIDDRAKKIFSDANVVADLKSFSLTGIHNAVNAAFCLAAVHHLISKPFDDIVTSIANFQGLPYRCQIVGKTSGGFDIINDSKSTNLESTLIALSSVANPAILMMGGAGKGESYKDLEKAKDKIAGLIAFGASRDDISRDAPKALLLGSHPKMRDAVDEALKAAKRMGCGILFSPGCASFDEFRNYEHRGDEFNKQVLAR